jgi:PAS domain S-box-containing protein
MTKECVSVQKGGDFATLGFSVQEIMDSMPVPCFLVNTEGLCVAGNHAFYAVVAGDRNLYVGSNPYQLLAPDYAEQFRKIDCNLFECGGVTSHEAEIQAADGLQKSVVLKKSVLTAETGERSHILVSILDLSEMTAIKNALNTSQSEKQAILDGFPGLLCLFDSDEKVIWANDRVRELNPDPVGKTCHQLLCGRDKSCKLCAVAKSISTGTVQSTVQQYEMLTSSGQELVYELTGTPVKDSSGNVISIVVIGRDVTDKNMLEKQLRHTQKMEAIGTLAGGIAHDFNNVLTPIMGYSEIIRLKLMQEKDPDESILEYLSGILRAAKRAKSLVEQILTFSRSSEQKESLQYIHPIVKEVMKLMRVTLPSTIVIKEHIDEQCGIISVDPVQIHQILINLCTNSAHAMAGGHGTLTVTLASGSTDQDGQEWLRLSVADTGCGIPPEMQERIFEPYFTTKEKSRGTGMGLAMVHGLISRQGGRIEVQSELGKGTTFEIFLPVTRKPTRIDQVVNMADFLRGQGRILLVDDEAQVVQVTGELLGSLGYEVTGRTSPYAALALFKENPAGFDLVLTDLTMPELTGVEFSREIKQVRKELPVVLFTGYSDQLCKEDALQAGIDEYCMKPVSLRELSNVIHATLTRGDRTGS